MAADLFETYAVTLIATMLLGSLLFPGEELLTLLPLLIGGMSILACIAGSFVVRIRETGSIMGGLYRGFIASSFLAGVALWPLFSANLRIRYS